jgi:hypothetical protein
MIWETGEEYIQIVEGDVDRGHRTHCSSDLT